MHQMLSVHAFDFGHDGGFRSHLKAKVFVANFFQLIQANSVLQTSVSIHTQTKIKTFLSGFKGSISCQAEV